MAYRTTYGRSNNNVNGIINMNGKSNYLLEMSYKNEFKRRLSNYGIELQLVVESSIVEINY